MLDETVEFSTLQDRVQMCKSGAFTDLKEMLSGLVDEAHEALVGCISGDPQVYMRLVIRYQQRIGVRREIDRWADSATQGLEQTTEAMRQDLERAENIYA